MTIETAAHAARLRVREGLATPDACIAAVAIEHDASIVGNDRRWRRLAAVEYLHIDDQLG